LHLCSFETLFLLSITENSLNFVKGKAMTLNSLPSLMTSFTEENYLKLIYKLSPDNPTGVNTNALAEQTQTKAASVTDMLRKLSDKGWVHYQKYQGVRLTSEGEALALGVIRKHRLWEVFLVEKLGFGWHEVHDIAEQLEHIESDSLIARLDEFLEFPQFDPHGDPIPNHHGQMPEQVLHPLSDCDLGQRAILLGVSEHSPAFLQYLGKMGLGIGLHLFITDFNEFDKSLTVQINDQNSVFLSHDAAKNLLVKNL
jgi:DtxR family transcriptional regulator, Mn-dependent transcriptional regulator